MRGRALLPFAIALLAGGVHAVSIAAPWNGQPQWWLQLISIGVLAWLVQREPRPKRAFLIGWAFATALQTATYWWLFISMHIYGGLAAPLTVIAVVGLAAFLGLYYAGAAALAATVKGPWRAVVFAALWSIAELLRVTVFTGFPWGAGGYAHLSGPLAGYAPWIGIHGMTFLAALVGAAAVTLPRHRGAAVVGALALLLGLALPLVGEFTPQPISAPVVRKSMAVLPSPLTATQVLQFSWTQLIELLHIDDPWKRAFYENECLLGSWSVRQLQR